MRYKPAPSGYPSLADDARGCRRMQEDAGGCRRRSSSLPLRFLSHCHFTLISDCLLRCVLTRCRSPSGCLASFVSPTSLRHVNVRVPRRFNHRNERQQHAIRSRERYLCTSSYMFTAVTNRWFLQSGMVLPSMHVLSAGSGAKLHPCFLNCT